MAEARPSVVRPATAADLDWVAALAQRHRGELGFVRRVVLAAAQARGELLVTMDRAGFCEYHRRRDGVTVVYAIASARRGGGQALVAALVRPVRAKCPADLAANGFWQHLGARLVATESGKRRALHVWELP